MERKFATNSLLSSLPSRRREPQAQAPGGGNDTKTAHFEGFCTQTLPHVDSVFSDAFCLTGNVEDAAGLVEAAYVRAFLGYEQFRRRRIPERLRAHSTLAWLYGNIHAAFCDRILAQERLPGDRGG